MRSQIERVALRDLVHRKLLMLILHGEFPPGSRVKDTELSQMLQVSRTPVREALVSLVKEGFLENLVGRGFVVRPLTAREVEEIYPIIWSLESLALRSSAPLSADALNSMETITVRMETTKPDFIRLIEFDKEWHQTLLSGCSNQRLMNMINDLKAIVFRYEYAFMQERQWVETSIREHRQIAGILTERGADAAEPVLKEHWAFSMQALLQKLNQTNDD
jgi:DNA-binding GntR family transcriptional regulator